jgi:hypothetical protein
MTTVTLFYTEHKAQTKRQRTPRKLLSFDNYQAEVNLFKTPVDTHIVGRSRHKVLPTTCSNILQHVVESANHIQSYITGCRTLRFLQRV